MLDRYFRNGWAVALTVTAGLILMCLLSVPPTGRSPAPPSPVPAAPTYTPTPGGPVPSAPTYTPTVRPPVPSAPTYTPTTHPPVPAAPTYTPTPGGGR